MVARARYVLSLPFYVLSIIIAVALGGMTAASRGLRRLSVGGQVHVFYPVLQIRRFIGGKPIWIPLDTIQLGIQPRTAKHRAVADADDRLLKIICDCGRPNCLNKDGHYIARPPGLRIPNGKE